jgi:hypothetical protein
MLQQQEEEKRRAETEAAKEATKAVDAKSLGRVFRDCPDCPEMVVVPAGSFMMGSIDGADETPVHKVTIAKPFAAGKFDVTFAEWDACVAASGCKHKPEDQGWGRGNRPVINVSWDDATKQYLPWLSRKTGKSYRLLTEAEWEYAARAGTTTSYSWSNDIGRNRTNCIGCGSQWDNKQTAPAGSFASNVSLFDMHQCLSVGSGLLSRHYQNANGRLRLMQSCEHSEAGRARRPGIASTLPQRDRPQLGRHRPTNSNPASLRPNANPDWVQSRGMSQGRPASLEDWGGSRSAANQRPRRVSEECLNRLITTGVWKSKQPIPDRCPEHQDCAAARWPKSRDLLSPMPVTTHECQFRRAPTSPGQRKMWSFAVAVVTAVFCDAVEVGGGAAAEKEGAALNP